MSYKVKVAAGKKDVQLPNGKVYQENAEVILTDAEYALLSTTAFSSGTLVDLGAQPGTGDELYDQAGVVAAPAAITSVALTGGTPPTEAQYNALRADVVALRTTLAATLVALKGVGKPIASA